MTTSYRNEISKRTIRNAPQSGKHHGEGPSDGAQRNARVASFVAARKAARENDKEKKIADRTAAAEKRKKETLAMATEEKIDEIFGFGRKKTNTDNKLERFPDSHKAKDWMTAKLNHELKHNPKDAHRLFSPASGDYMPLNVHVGSSWKKEHQDHYRDLKKKHPDLVQKAKKDMERAGAHSQSRVGDPEDFHGVKLAEETQTHVFHAHIKPLHKDDKISKVVLKVKASNKNEATNKASKHLAKNYGVGNVSSVVHKGIMEETGTEARTKIKNVARPGDADPMSKDSTLVKTGEIKKKKIDEGRSMSINRNFGLSDSLIAATRELLEKRNESANNVGKGKTVVDTDPETNDRDVNDEVTEKKGKKKLDPVGKEDDDIDNDGDVDKSDKYLHGRRKAIGKAMKEEAEQIDEVFYTVRGHDTGSIGSPTKFIGSAISKAMDHTKAGRKVTVKSHDHENGHIDSVTINPGDHVKRAIEGLKKVREPVKEEVDEAFTAADLKKQLQHVARKEKMLPPGISAERKALAIHKEKLTKAHNKAMGMKEEAEINEAKDKIAHFVSKVGNNTYHARVSDKHFSLSNQHGIAEHPSAVIDTDFQGYHKADEHARGIMDSFKRGGKEAALNHLNSVTYNHKKFKHAGVNEEAEQIAELKHSGILSRYIKAVKHDVDDDVASPKRKAGYHMALKKKWGDKKHGFDEPRVKATNEEFSDAELARIKEIVAKFDNIQESPATERA